MSAKSAWYIHHNGKEHGPFSAAQLKKLASSGKINEDSKVRMGVDGKWVSARKVKGLFPARELSSIPTAKAPAVVSKPAPNKLVEAPPTAPVFLESASTKDIARTACPMCGEIIAVTAKKCRHCNEFLDGSRPQPPAPDSAQQVNTVPTPQPSINVNVVQQVGNVVQQVGVGGKRWSRLVAGLLSFIIPGAGQLYKGQVVNAIAWFVLTTIGYIAFIIPGLILHLLCIVGAVSGNPYK